MNEKQNEAIALVRELLACKPSVDSFVLILEAMHCIPCEYADHLKELFRGIYFSTQNIDEMESKQQQEVELTEPLPFSPIPSMRVRKRPMGSTYGRVSQQQGTRIHRAMINQRDLLVIELRDRGGEKFALRFLGTISLKKTEFHVFHIVKKIASWDASRNGNDWYEG